ncbi:sulfatase-like hydrolase/transferase [Cytophaga sp. FL35]|uniref:sulfatase-like hydrolase/transferase n=1 Tax=Cytophaga sp. FL35 TaxID=1904456 RepID=UPI0016538EC0|nr:sulfatase-like hydrolase/transferase [Cytophaga sp. FL35]MBC6998028.1 sulfatase-like hydrolase/transferase [Cytophaga sp. FL35]
MTILTKKAKFALCITLLGCSIWSKAQDDRPNILMILCDDLGYGDVGFNGSKDIRTPEMDKLAKTGTIFTSAYVAHPFCGPSRSAIMTGRYPHLTGTPYNLYQNSSQDDKDNMGIPLKEVFVSKALQDAGYYTSAIGKWHLGAAPKFHPDNRGFNNFYGFLGGGHDYFPDEYQEVYRKQLAIGNKEIRDYVLPLEHNGNSVNESEYLTDAFSREAVNEIKTATNKKQPFFIYLAYNAPHVPLEAKPADLKEFSSIENKDRKTYAAMVYAVDRGIGQIVKALKETSQYENTLIVFYSDNGGNTNHGASNYPLKGSKGDTWEGGYRTPMFFHWPNKITEHENFNFPVSSLDLYPTFLGLAKSKPPVGKKLDGKNILSNILNRTNPRENEMLFALRYREGYCDVGGRLGDWKITRMGNEPWRLHNLKEDIGEKKNLSGRYPEKLKQMVATTEDWTKDFIQPLWYYSLKDKELWENNRMPMYNETFEIDKLVQPAHKN